MSFSGFVYTFFFALLIFPNCIHAQTYFYILNPNAVNFTNFTMGLQAALSTGLPLRVRNNAIIFENETIPTITTPLTIIGDTVGLISAYLFIQPNQSPLFQITNSGDLFVRNLQIIFNNTLFNTQLNGLLRLSHVNLWQGTIGISIQNVAGPSNGLVADMYQCMNLRICILYLTTGSSVNCTNCRFMNELYTGVSVTSTTSSALTGINIFNSNWINLQWYITVQPQPNAVPIQYPLPSNWGFINNNVITLTFKQNCAEPTPSPSPLPFGGGGGSSGGSGTCPQCEKCVDDTYGSPSIWTIILLVIGFLILVFMVLRTVESVAEPQSLNIRVTNPVQKKE